MSNSNFPLAVEKYLSKYFDPKWELEYSPTENITTAVVIPAICEFENIKRLLKSLINNDPDFLTSTLIIFVINNIENQQSDIVEENEKSLSFIRSIIHKKNNDELAKMFISSNLQIALVDSSSPGKEMPSKDGGVGLARKIGMDLALTIFDYSLSLKKILISLDADCIVETNYLSEIISYFNKKNLSAAVVNFQHDYNSNNETAAAVICYEIFLRYYVLGLRFADSLYAFHTIGSSMACDYESYIKIEGMNRKKAAEDFYFLEKLAKNVSIRKINTTVVYPSSRGSWRVPFGTGQRIKRFLLADNNEYLLYEPKSFFILKDWLKEFNSSEIFSSNQYLKIAKEIHKELYQFLIDQNFEIYWEKIRISSKNSTKIYKQKLKWFDGFKTLKLIHHLRDTAFPQKNMFDALDIMLNELKIKKIPNRFDQIIPDLEVQKIYLNLLRELDKT